MLGWVFCLLVLLLYMAAIACVQLIGRSEEGLYPGRIEEAQMDEWEAMQEFNPFQRFGSILRSMYTLFCVAAEDTFNAVGLPLLEKQPMMFFFLVIFVLIASCGMMNVILGVLIERTMSNVTIQKGLEEDE